MFSTSSSSTEKSDGTTDDGEDEGGIYAALWDDRGPLGKGVIVVLILLTLPVSAPFLVVYLAWKLGTAYADALQEASYGSDSTYYDTREWKRLSRQCKQRDNWTCRSCGASGPGVELHADHIIPRSRGGADALSNLQTLCVHCHSAKTGRPVGSLAWD